MSVGELGNERAVVKIVERSGDVVAALVPEVGEVQEGEVTKGNGGKEE